MAKPAYLSGFSPARSTKGVFYVKWQTDCARRLPRTVPQLFEMSLAPHLHWGRCLVSYIRTTSAKYTGSVMYKNERAGCPRWLARIASKVSVSLVLGPLQCMARNTAPTRYIYMSYYVHKTAKGSKLVYYIVPKNGTLLPTTPSRPTRTGCSCQYITEPAMAVLPPAQIEGSP